MQVRGSHCGSHPVTAQHQVDHQYRGDDTEDGERAQDQAAGRDAGERSEPVQGPYADRQERTPAPATPDPEAADKAENTQHHTHDQYRERRLVPRAAAPSAPSGKGAIETARPTMLIIALMTAAAAFEVEIERTRELLDSGGPAGLGGTRVRRVQFPTTRALILP